MPFQPLVLIADSSLATQSNIGDLLSEQAVLNSILTPVQLDYWCQEPKQTPHLLIIERDFLGSKEKFSEFFKQWSSHPLTRRCDVMLIGKMDAAEEAAFLELGVVDCLHKPIEPLIAKARIELRLRQLLQRRLLEDMSFTDALTQVANRRYLQEFVSAEWRRASREGGNIGFIMVDIDHFKLLNDHYGHQYGDECLLKVAQALKSVVKRPRDLVARYGGEEFSAVLPNIQPRGLNVVTKRMLQKVQSLHISHAASPIAPSLTISIGVSWGLPAYNCDRVSESHLIELADKSLYEVKHNGRNNVGRTLEVTPQKSLI